MNLSDKSCVEFVEILASKDAILGGGSASALVAAIGIALGSMVCNLTIGKKKYIEFEDEIKIILEKANSLEKKLLQMIDEDSKNFIPLSKAYSLSSNTEEEKILKAEVMEKSLKLASEVPINLVKACVEAIKLHERLVDIGSKIAISDVGVGVQCLRSALLSAKLNVIININSMKDSEYVDKVKEEIDELVNEGVKICDEVYAKVELILS